MKISVWRPFVFFMVTAIILTGAIAFAFPQYYGVSWPWTLGVFTAVYALSFFIFQKAVQKNPKSIALVFLALTTGKMLLGMIYILVLSFGLGIDSLSDSLYFVVLYFCYLVIEVTVFTKVLKRESDNQQAK